MNVDSGAGDLVAVGGDLEPSTLLAAYRLGLFPMHVTVPREVVAESASTPGVEQALSTSRIGWWSPDPRGVLDTSAFKMSRSLRQSVGKYRCTLNHDFAAVVAGCADQDRAGGWIKPEIVSAYVRLHELGWAHSVEVWQGDLLAGGLYGVAVGGLFAGESMFHRARDASKVALATLIELLVSAPAPERRLLDVQWLTPHLASLGAEEIDRREYLRRLDRALELAVPTDLLAGADHQ